MYAGIQGYRNAGIQGYRIQRIYGKRRDTDILRDTEYTDTGIQTTGTHNTVDIGI